MHLKREQDSGCVETNAAGRRARLTACVGPPLATSHTPNDVTRKLRTKMAKCWWDVSFMSPYRIELPGGQAVSHVSLSMQVLRHRRDSRVQPLTRDRRGNTASTLKHRNSRCAKSEGHELCGGSLTNHRARRECHVIYRHHLCCPEFGQGLVQVVDLRGEAH